MQDGDTVLTVLPIAERQSQQRTNNDSDAETNGHGLDRTLVDRRFGFVEALAHCISRLLRLGLNGFYCLVSIFSGCLGSPTQGVRSLRRHSFQEVLHSDAGLARSLLNQADKLLDIALDGLQVFIRQLAPLGAELALNLVPVVLKRLLIDHSKIPFKDVIALYFSLASGPIPETLVFDKP